MNLSLLQKRKGLFVIGICVVLILGITFFYFKKPAASETIVDVTKGSITEQAEAVGNIKTCNFSTVNPDISPKEWWKLE